MPLKYEGVSVAPGERVMAIAGERPGPWYLYAYDGEDRGNLVGSAPKVDLWNCKFFVWRDGPENQLLAGIAGELTGFQDSIVPLCEFWYLVVWDGEKERLVRARDGMELDQELNVLLWDDGLVYAQRGPDTPVDPNPTGEQEDMEAFAFTCPECGAPPGVRCPGRPRSGLHTPRLMLSPSLLARIGHTTSGDSPQTDLGAGAGSEQGAPS